MRGMPSRTEVIDHYAKVSGRQVDDLDYYLVLAKWKLAIVLEQGFQRAGDQREAARLRPRHRRPDAVGRRPRRIQRLHVTRAAVCPEYGPPEVVRIEEQPTQPLEEGQDGCGSAPQRSTTPTSCSSPNQYQISVPPPFVVGSEFAGVIVEVSGEAGGFAVGDRVTGTQMFGAFAEEIVVTPRRWPGFRTASTTARRRRSGWPIGPRITRCGRSRECVRATPSSCSAPAAASDWPPCSWPLRSAPTSPPSRHRPKSSTQQPHTAQTTSSITDRAICARRCGTPCPTARTPSSTPSAAICPNPRCGRCAAAAGSSPSATPRVSSPPSHSTLFWSRVCTCWDSSSRTSLRRVRPQRGRNCTNCSPPARWRRTSARSIRLPKPRARYGMSPTGRPSARC